ncbi:transforming growth factor-beta-induced protein ig-h3-like [Physella acuta]|uniref:transforming growth factor-beta-induced protein ig-h3-like n=1 Tax=Physella acuta TaxID=109671 RepID=UPI0027DE9B17|nr:transforming growth factor-beta-induced protein ig-h3-like [Physella acuta]
MRIVTALLLAVLLSLTLTLVEGRRRDKSWRDGRDRLRQKDVQRDRGNKNKERNLEAKQPFGRSRNPFHDFFTSFHELDPFSYFNFRWNVESRADPWWEGPNVCENEIKEVVNSTEGVGEMMRHFSTNFQSCDESETAYKCKMVQEDAHGRKELTVIYECCHGFSRNERDFGCPNRVTIKSLMEKTEELGLTDFVKAVKTLKLTKEFENGNFTLFVPENGAFSLDSDLIDAGTGIILKDAPAVIAISEPAVDKALKSLQNALLSHMITGMVRSSAMDDEQVIITGNPEGSTIRVNHFTRPEKLMTVNCVPLVTRDHMATNGVIHTVAKVLKPVTESLLEIVKSKPELNTLRKILALANYIPKLEQDGQLTILAPTDDAFERMNSRLKDRLLSGDITCIEKVLQNHLLPNVICSAAIQGQAKTPNLLHQHLTVNRTEDNKVFIGGSQVIQSDIMGTNGVLHVIDDVLVPDEALGFLDILEKQGLTELLSLIEKTGMSKTLETDTNFTVFAPTNAAFKDLTNGMKTKLAEDPQWLKNVLNFHISKGVKECNHLHDNELLPTLSGNNMRINTYSVFPFHHRGIRTAQCVPIKQMNIEACNARINIIENVMIPPRGNVIDVLALDKKFSTLVSLLKKANIADLLQEDGPYTIFAPNNEAFDSVDDEVMSKLERDPEKLKQLLQRHIYEDMLCCAGIFRGHWLGNRQVKTMSQDLLKLSRTHDGIPKVGHGHVIKCDQTATNGNVLELDKVLLHEPHQHKWRFNPFAGWDDF